MRNNWKSTGNCRSCAPANAPGPVLDFGPERGPGKGTMADLGPLIRLPIFKNRTTNGNKLDPLVIVEVVVVVVVSMQ